ncbi:MAG: dihydropteroate synthase [Flavobacteriales bacterium]
MTINCKGKLLNLDSPIVMGILNVTPDSFYDGGNFMNTDEIVNQVRTIIGEGAAIIDLGGVSSRPGADDVSQEEELERVIPAINLIISEFPEALISVDTFRSEVAKQSIEAGACIINDITAGEGDSKMFETIRELQVPYCIMHKQGSSAEMQNNPIYKNVTEDIFYYLSEKLNELKQLGVNDVILDPGFGFGKTVEHNYQLLNQLSHFKNLNTPILVGVSRKSMIQKVLDTTSENSLNGTTALHAFALQNGANILRVHDVKEAVETIKLYNKLLTK